MRLVWVLGSKKTGIYKYSKIAKEALSKFFKIRFICAEKEPDFNIESDEEVIYNIGNSKDCLNVYLMMKKRAGITIMHDRTYQNLFAFYFLEYLKDKSAYLETISLLYGEDAYRTFKRIDREALWEKKEYALSFPLRELIYPYSKAIVCHSKNFSLSIKEEYPGYVKYIPFPFKAGKIKPGSFSNSRYKILTYGFLSKNRMVKEVAELITKNDFLRKNFIYLIAGEIDEDLKKELSALNKSNSVRILGFVSERKLKKLLSEAFLCINLRKYSTEVASWSLLEQMSAQKPVVVFNEGFFLEIPDDSAIKISSINELEDILVDLAKDPGRAIEIGKRAGQFVEKNFSAELYAEKFKDLLVSEKHKSLYLMDITDWLAKNILSLSEDKALLSAVSSFLGDAVEEIFE